MKETLMIVVLICIALIIVSYPFKIRGAFHVNVLKDVGFIVIKLFWFKLFCARFKISSDGKLLVEEIKKRKRKPNKMLLMYYFSCLIKKIDVKKIELYFTGGSDSDAHYVSMLCGCISSISAAVFSVLINKYRKIKIYNNIEPNFSDNKLETTMAFAVRFSLLNVMSSLLCAYKSYFKKKKELKK